MLSIPTSRPWRFLWDVDRGSLTSRLDELAKRRRVGRQVPPPVRDSAEARHVVLARYYAEGRVSSPEFFEQKVEPLLKACVSPRWLRGFSRSALGERLRQCERAAWRRLR
jgi:hypothetical protein